MKKNHRVLILGKYTSWQSKLLTKIFQVATHGTHAAKKQVVGPLAVTAREETAIIPKLVATLTGRIESGTSASHARNVHFMDVWLSKFGLFVLSIEILIVLFLSVTFGDKVRRAITTTAALCYLYYDSYTIWRVTDIFLGSGFQNEKHSWACALVMVNLENALQTMQTTSFATCDLDLALPLVHRGS